MYAKTTRVPSAQTRAEIERLLARAKARSYGTAVDHETRQARVQFRLHERYVRFTLALPERVGRLRAEAAYDQVERQRWRALLLVIKAKLEAVESQITTFEEEFLAHIVLPTDITVADAIRPAIAHAYATGQLPSAFAALPPAPEASDG